MILALGLLLLCPGAELARARQDPPAKTEAQESELDKLLRSAKTGRAMIRPQAARRIVRMWSRGEEADRAPIVERLVAETGADNDSLAALGSALIEVLGEFEDERLRAKLWSAVDDPEFPWRPYAARGLATATTAAELERFRPLLEDHIAPVRSAAITAIHTLEARQEVPALRRLLADEVDFVRRSAADLLYRWGEKDALWYLFEELHRDDRFFDRPTGREARYQTYNLISRHLDDLANFDAGKSPEQNRVVLAVLATKVTKLAGARPELAVTAHATVQDYSELIGLEVRSCRRGEHYLRWTSDDRLLVGLGSPALVSLPAGTVEALIDSGNKRTSEVEPGMVGSPGCDLEMLHWRHVDATQMWIISKGPESVEDLRPAPLDVFYADLIATLPDDASDDPRLHRLRSRVVSALQSVGGDL
ncbi:MAG: HEAT repeat domain-containing protein [Planctomycetota bacterium]|nr:HEAT repeat domain-containing protein [Planctomycetota bacterium]